MKLKITVSSTAYDEPYGGEQILECAIGEFILDEIFRLHFFRIIIDDIIDDALCFRLMEGGIAHYFVLDSSQRVCNFERQTSIGSDYFVFELQE